MRPPVLCICCSSMLCVANNSNQAGQRGQEKHRETQQRKVNPLVLGGEPGCVVRTAGRSRRQQIALRDTKQLLLQASVIATHVSASAASSSVACSDRLAELPFFFLRPRLSSFFTPFFFPAVTSVLLFSAAYTLPLSLAGADASPSARLPLLLFLSSPLRKPLLDFFILPPLLLLPLPFAVSSTTSCLLLCITFSPLSARLYCGMASEAMSG